MLLLRWEKRTGILQDLKIFPVNMISAEKTTIQRIFNLLDGCFPLYKSKNSPIFAAPSGFYNCNWQFTIDNKQLKKVRQLSWQSKGLKILVSAVQSRPTPQTKSTAYEQETQAVFICGTTQVQHLVCSLEHGQQCVVIPTKDELLRCI